MSCLFPILEREKKQINRERGNFFTNVSHELRTPLTLILSPLQELLQTERLSETLHDKLSLVYNNATSSSTLVNQLLYVQKIEAGMVQLHLSKVEIVALVEHVMSSFRHMAEIKSTEYVLNSGISSLDLWLDAPKIESALKNLLFRMRSNIPQGRKDKGYDHGEGSGRENVLFIIRCRQWSRHR